MNTFKKTLLVVIAFSAQTTFASWNFASWFPTSNRNPMPISTSNEDQLMTYIKTYISIIARRDCEQSIYWSQEGKYYNKEKKVDPSNTLNEIKALVRKGTDVNKFDISIYYSADFRVNPLLVLSLFLDFDKESGKNFVPVLNILATSNNHKLDTEVRFRGNTPLEIALYKKKLAFAQALIRIGATVTLRSEALLKALNDEQKSA